MATLNQSSTIVIKVGSALLVDALGCIKTVWLESVAQDIAKLKANGKKIVVVSSGSIAVGKNLLSISDKNTKLDIKQAAAAVGQISLAEAWANALKKHGIVAAQMLLTYDDTEERKRHLNATATMESLLNFGCVPIINENDSVATNEIRYGDNDRLGARVAVMLGADTLVLLTDVDGLYTANPQTDSTATHIPELHTITSEIESMASGGNSLVSTGGMHTKLLASKIAQAGGCKTIMSKGTDLNPINSLNNGAKHTIIQATNKPMPARKRWVAGTVEISGTVSIDNGAKSALIKGASLLPVGITAITGSFNRGDMLAIKDPDGTEIARGLTLYNSKEALKILGKNSDEIDAILGYHRQGEIIHRDDMVFVGVHNNDT